MSHGDPSQAELRAEVGLLEELPPPQEPVAGVQLRNASADHTEIVQPDKIPFTEDDVTAMAAMMQRQGTWFMGIEVRTYEQAMNTARDLLIMLWTMGYKVPQLVDPLEVFEAVSGQRVGQAGNTR